MPDFVTTNLRFPEATWRELRLQASRRRTTAAGLVREAVEQYLGRGGDDGPSPFDGDAFDKHIGAITRSAGDESVNHDHYLYGWPKETEREAPRRLERSARSRHARRSKPRGRKRVRAKSSVRTIRPL
jgi:hypothetical protein